ncbi:MAG: ABC transporter ATP-binding protein [Anaerolineae bacterium]|nr:ABC transporter ATP-binding protein [Anaerolineae bacterium]
MAEKPVLLETRRVSKNFGGVVAIHNVDLTVRAGEIMALIGPNGAGKTTMFNLISGTHALDKGEILFAGQRISGRPPHCIAAAGVVRTFQNLQIFGNMTVLENVMAGSYLQGRAGFLKAALRWPGVAAEESRLQEQAMEYLTLVGLTRRANHPAASLPYGQQRLVEIARALAVQPKLLLLDEPAAGLTRVETDTLNELIYRIQLRGITVLLVEHDMNLVMGVADRVAVLHYAQKIAEGTPSEIQCNPMVIQAYLGLEWQSAMLPSARNREKTDA